MHFNCHNQELAPFTSEQIRAFIDALLIAGASAEDALAASFCLLRCGSWISYRIHHHSPQPLSLLQ